MVRVMQDVMNRCHIIMFMVVCHAVFYFQGSWYDFRIKYIVVLLDNDHDGRDLRRYRFLTPRIEISRDCTRAGYAYPTH